MYGRLAIVADVLAPRTQYFIGVGALFYEGWVDNVVHQNLASASVLRTNQGSLIVPTGEEVPLAASPGDTFSAKAILAEQRVLAINTPSDRRSLMLRFAKVYGPRQPLPTEWCVVKRVIDGRQVMLVPDAGLLLQSRVFSLNAASYVLAAVDRIEAAAGQAYNVSDATAVTLREWIQLVSKGAGNELDPISVPLAAAALTFPYSKGPFVMAHRVLSIDKARRELQVDGLLPPEDALRITAEWHMVNPLGREDENRLGDAFDYQLEDRLSRLSGAFTARATRLSTSHA
jgi:nucleoside-diphosphate-sugar epimerase